MNTAARIQGAAPINGIVVGVLTHEATKHAIEYEEAEPVEAEGKSEPVRVWVARRRRRCRRAARAARARSSVATASWRAARAVEEVQRQRLPGMATVVGAPGIGKSRLLDGGRLHASADAA